MKGKALPSSPCTGKCCLDPDDLCVGCGRSLDEITGWHVADTDERQAIIRRSKQRLQQAAPGACDRAPSRGASGR